VDRSVRLEDGTGGRRALPIFYCIFNVLKRPRLYSLRDDQRGIPDPREKLVG
jgi:hypothetical protein